MKKDNQSENVIFTDTFKTKEIIWEAYYGYITHYKEYKMNKSIKRIDPIVILGLNKFAYYFHDEVIDFFEKFEKQLIKENIDKASLIIARGKFEESDYDFLRRFYAKFMIVSGIKNIVREKEDHDHSVRYSR